MAEAPSTPSSSSSSSSSGAAATPGSAASAKKLLSSTFARRMAGLDLRDYSSEITTAQAVMIQYREAHAMMPSGMFCVPDNENLLRFHGLIVIRSSLPYGGNAMKFTVDLPPCFPANDAMPSIRFGKRPRHPLIAPKTGVFALEHFVPEWRMETQLIEAFKAVKAAFRAGDADMRAMCESPHLLDPAAADAYLTNPEEFIAVNKERAAPLVQSLLQAPLAIATDPLRGSRVVAAGANDEDGNGGDDDEGEAAGEGGSEDDDGGFRFTAASTAHTRLLEFLAERARTATDIFSFVEQEVAATGSRVRSPPATPTRLRKPASKE